MTNCANCDKAISTLEVFPGGICLDCYAVTPEANAPITADELTAMWGGPVRKRRR